jgi:hypothetical protein
MSRVCAVRLDDRLSDPTFAEAVSRSRSGDPKIALSRVSACA